ncbi:MAG: sulfatase, partial [Proteobacteria bacterium]|nr:sulfatase [Pseudomonadota bacterium]
SWLTGIGAAAWLDLMVRWFTDPAPFQSGWSYQGNPLVFLALTTIMVGILVLAIRLAQNIWAIAIVHAVLVVSAWLWIVADRPINNSGNTTSPNLLLITLDTARADRFDGKALIAPGFTRVAREGVRFDKAISQIPATGPSHLTLFSAAPPWKHGALLNGAPTPEHLPLLSEKLNDMGYVSGAFVSSYVLNGNLGFSRGFNVYLDDFGLVRGLDRVTIGRLFRWIQRGTKPPHLERRANETVDLALKWLNRQEGAWFAWVHLFDPHGPYEPPQPWDHRYYEGFDPRDPNNPSMKAVEGVAPYQRLDGITDVDWVIAQYDGEVAYADSQMERLLDWLDRSNQTNHTLVVVLGDHGEGLGEEGEWFNHGDWLYEHDIRVPLAMRLPDLIEAGKTVDEVVAISDVAPTILDYLGLPGSHSLRSGINTNQWAPSTVGSICFDREANRLERQKNKDFPPTYRMASARSRQGLYIAREHDDFEDRVFFFVEPEDRQLATENLRRQAKALFEGEGGAPDLSETDRARLEALGYIEP